VEYSSNIGGIREAKNSKDKQTRCSITVKLVAQETGDIGGLNKNDY